MHSIHTIQNVWLSKMASIKVLGFGRLFLNHEVTCHMPTSVPLKTSLIYFLVYTSNFGWFTKRKCNPTGINQKTKGVRTGTSFHDVSSKNTSEL